MIVDVDIVRPGEPENYSFIHYMIANIRGGNIRTGEEVKKQNGIQEQIITFLLSDLAFDRAVQLQIHS